MRIHILAAAGMMTTPLALELKRMGHQVSGSDQEKIYPPFSDQISKAGIPLNSTPIDKNIDLYIVGSAYKNIPTASKEFQLIQSQNLPYIAATEYLAKNLIRPNSILVAGSYGKTTISCLLAWIFKELGLNPSYFFGSQSLNGIESLKITDSSWSIVEADESINGLDTQAKFLYYPVKYAILTSANWEHKDSYPTFEKNLEAFKKLIEKIPSDGLLVYNPNDPDLKKIVSSAVCKTIPYDKSINLKTNLIGDYNYQNCLAAATLCQALGLEMDKVLNAISTFKGVSRRLEVVGSVNNILFIDDFAQSATRISSAISAVCQTYPDKNIIVYLEPNASFLQNIQSLTGFKNALNLAHTVILSQLKFNKVTKDQRASAKDWQQEVGDKLKYLPINQDIYQYLTGNLKPNDILIHFSASGLDGINILYRVIDYFNKSA